MTVPPSSSIPSPSQSSSEILPQSKKLQGREFYNSIGQPKTIVAPMVDQSELAWRILSRRYGAELCYTPMFHAKLFVTSEKYRQNMWDFTKDGNFENDRPLIVQFCANDPDYLLQASKIIENNCDAIDLNLGCPQGIAKKGKYGAFLMDDWDLIYKLIKNLHDNLKIPVTAKIRIYDDWEKSLEYAKMVLKAGAQFITIHGRTRDMKGQQTGLANWKILKYLRDNLPKDQVFFANGNILYPIDLKRCMNETLCDAVMSAEGNLYNPGVFWTKNNDINKQFPRVDKLLREYFEIVKSIDTLASRHSMKAHFFKIMHEFLNIHKELRPIIGQTSVHSSYDDWEKIVIQVEEIINKIYENPNIKEIDIIEDNNKIEEWGGSYKIIPYWRCQPYFRKVDGEKQNTRLLKIAGENDLVVTSDEAKQKKLKRELEDDSNDNVVSKKQAIPI